MHNRGLARNSALTPDISRTKSISSLEPNRVHAALLSELHTFRIVFIAFILPLPLLLSDIQSAIIAISPIPYSIFPWQAGQCWSESPWVPANARPEPFLPTDVACHIHMGPSFLILAFDGHNGQLASSMGETRPAVSKRGAPRRQRPQKAVGRRLWSRQMLMGSRKR